MSKTFHILSTGSWPRHIAELQTGLPPGQPEFCWHEHAFITIKPLRTPALQEELKLLATRELEVIFTSRQAVLAVSALLDAFPHRWTANMLEGATCKTFDRIYPEARRHAQGHYAENLAAYITRCKPKKSFVFFCGDKRRDTLPALLQRHGITWEEITVYKTTLNPVSLERHFDGIIFFSPAAVESYFKNNRPASDSVLFAIGKTTAASIKPYWAGRIICPPHPDKTEMFHTVQNYFNTLL